MIRFPYRSDPQGGIPRWRPLAHFFVRGAVSRRRVRGLFDTGSDDTVFPLWLAASLGVQLSPRSHRVIWGGQSFPMQFGNVGFELMDGDVGYQWQATVGFSSAPLRYLLLGNRGCLQFFDATFCGKDLAVELTINRSFQGTVL